MSSEYILEVENLVKRYQVQRVDRPGHEVFTAVDDISFALRRGGSLGVLGESGSGKSTTVRVIVGLETLTSGTVRVNGEPWKLDGNVGTRVRRQRGSVVQMVFQDPYQSLNRRQSVAACLDEALRLHTDLRKAARAERIKQLAHQVHIPESLLASYPRALSGGQRQRVAIARALAANPKLLLLDEAVSALDVSVQGQVLELLEEIRRTTGVALLFISHDLAVVQRVCDEVVVMRNGKIVESGPIPDVLGNPQSEYTRRLIASIPRRGWKPRRSLNTTMAVKQ
ncbi:ABC transporter ATP-binding protein [Arthrobacter sp. S2(2024)]|uniref:ABC transporter ATP-binding protein n=1 Tax=Arthrobacter sp. S2(2024) TaxID=3111911 RepID=UPI002FCC56C3